MALVRQIESFSIKLKANAAGQLSTINGLCNLSNTISQKTALFVLLAETKLITNPPKWLDLLQWVITAFFVASCHFLSSSLICRLPSRHSPHTSQSRLTMNRCQVSFSAFQVTTYSKVCVCVRVCVYLHMWMHECLWMCERVDGMYRKCGFMCHSCMFCVRFPWRYPCSTASGGSETSMCYPDTALLMGGPKPSANTHPTASGTVRHDSLWVNMQGAKG